MNENDRLIKKMIELGISATEARIYAALLQKPELTAMEIQKIALVPRTKVYEIAHRMVMNNMCIEKRIRGRKKFQVAEPEKFFRNLDKKRECEMKGKKHVSSAISRQNCTFSTRRAHGIDFTEREALRREVYHVCHKPFILSTGQQDSL